MTKPHPLVEAFAEALKDGDVPSFERRLSAVLEALAKEVIADIFLDIQLNPQPRVKRETLH